MRRRLALQILASSTFGSSIITAARAESSGLKQNDGNPAADLLSALNSVHQEASLYLRDASVNELRVVTADVAFFAQEAHSRAASGSFDTPAFWQSCHDRFQIAKAVLTSNGNGRKIELQVVQKLDQCLPVLRVTLERTLA